MLRQRNEYPRVRTPKGTAIWPALNEPDYKFKENGEYHARLVFEPDTPGLDEVFEQAQELLDEAFEAKKAELKRLKKGALIKKLNKAPILRDEEDEETGEPTGRVILRAALTARVDIKKGPKAGTSFSKKPDLFNARGNRLHNPPKIGGGSEMKLNVTIMDYFMPKDATVGVRFELNAAQIIKLVSNGSRSADDYGFGEEDGDEIEDREDSGGFEDEGEGYEGSGDEDDADF